jgi:hypothetical protein
MVVMAITSLFGCTSLLLMMAIDEDVCKGDWGRGVYRKTAGMK